MSNCACSHTAQSARHRDRIRGGEQHNWSCLHIHRAEEVTVVLSTAVSAYDRCFGGNRPARWRGNTAADVASDPAGSKNGQVAEMSSDRVRRRLESRLMDMLPGAQPSATRSKRASSDDCYFGKRIRDGGLELG
jgi:hypothetical protein